MIHLHCSFYRQCGIGAMILIGALHAAAQTVPVITNAADGSSSAAFWYLGGGSSVDGYLVQWRVNLTAPAGDTNPTPTITWSSDRTDLISIAPASDGLSAVLTALRSSDTTRPGSFPTPSSYNIHITAVYDGVSSAGFPVYLNTPFAMTTSASQYCSGGVCSCDAFFPREGDHGYITLNVSSVQDILGETLVPIRLNESLENQHFVAAGWVGSGFPVAGKWTPAGGSGAAPWQSNNTFNDYFYICTTNTTRTPPITSYGSGTTAIFTETQKFWIGTTTAFSGVCAQRGLVTLYTDHGGNSSVIVPGIPSGTICNRGAF